PCVRVLGVSGELQNGLNIIPLMAAPTILNRCRSWRIMSGHCSDRREDVGVTMSSSGPQNGRKSDSAPAGRVQPGANGPGAAKGTGAAKMPPRRSWLWFVVALVVNFFLVRLLMPGAEGPVTVPYTLFKEEVGKGNVQAIYSRGDTITGRFKAPVPYPPAG